MVIRFAAALARCPPQAPASKSGVGVAVFVTLWPLLAAAEEGRPVAAADLSGKTICWNDGRVTTYYPDGRETDSRGVHSIWSVPEPGVVQYRYHSSNMVVLPDGRFETRYWQGAFGGSQTNNDRYIYHWANVCNPKSMMYSSCSSRPLR